MNHGFSLSQTLSFGMLIQHRKYFYIFSNYELIDKTDNFVPNALELYFNFKVIPDCIMYHQTLDRGRHVLMKTLENLRM